MYKDDSLTLHTDLYQINMMQVYFNQGIHNKKAVFEVYFRQLPFKNGFAVFAGLERIVNYLENLTFSETDIAYLKELGYPKDFLDYLANLKLELTINSALEGDLVFANEPIFQVEGPLAQCQICFPCCHGSTGAAGRTAGNMFQIPRVSGHAIGRKCLSYLLIFPIELCPRG